MKYLFVLLTFTVVVSSCKKNGSNCTDCKSADVAAKTTACRVIVNDIFNTRLSYWADSGSCAGCFTNQYNLCDSIAKTIPASNNELCDSLYSKFKFDIIASAAMATDVVAVDSAKLAVSRDKANERFDDILECAQ